MSKKRFKFGPLALTTAVANILNPPTTTGGVNAGSSSQYILLYWITVANRTGGAATFNLFLGATGASASGTEISAAAKSVAANDSVTLVFPSGLRLEAADFLTGNASANTTLTIFGGGEIGVTG